MKKFRYKLNCGQYVLHADDKPIQACIDEVAICLDKEAGVRMKIGEPDMVHTWHKKAQDDFNSAGLTPFAEDLVVIQGRFTLEDLNKVFDYTHGAKALYDKVMAGTADSLDLQGNIVRAVTQ